MKSAIATKPKCLIVEDDEDCRWIVMRALMKLEFDCDVARDGVQAMQMLKVDTYHVVVTDLKMPNKHGFSLASEIKQAPNPPAVIVYTGVEEPKLVAQLYALGVDDVCIKPISPDVLAAKVNAIYLRSAQQPQQKQSTQPSVQERGKASARDRASDHKGSHARMASSPSKGKRKVVKLAAGAG